MAGIYSCCLLTSDLEYCVIPLTEFLPSSVYIGGSFFSRSSMQWSQARPVITLYIQQRVRSQHHPSNWQAR